MYETYNNSDIKNMANQKKKNSQSTIVFLTFPLSLAKVQVMIRKVTKGQY